MTEPAHCDKHRSPKQYCCERESADSTAERNDRLREIAERVKDSQEYRDFLFLDDTLTPDDAPWLLDEVARLEREVAYLRGTIGGYEAALGGSHRREDKRKQQRDEARAEVARLSEKVREMRADDLVRGATIRNLEADERITAWLAVAAHPVLTPARGDGDVFLPAVLRRLDALNAQEALVNNVVSIVHVELDRLTIRPRSSEDGS